MTILIDTKTESGGIAPPVTFDGTALSSEPFLHAAVAECLHPKVAEALLSWFETTAPWKLVEADFYEQWEFSLWDTPAFPATALTNDVPMRQIRDAVSRLYGRTFLDKVDIVAHKLVEGQHIGIHNDYLEGHETETHRLTLQLNRGLKDEDGGLFLIFNSGDACDIHMILRPVHLSGVTFEISSASYHAVSRQYGGERYTLVFSFYAA